MISSDKGKEEMGGLVYAIALNPLDPAHLVHNGCDKGLECVQIGVRRQGPEDVGEAEAWVAEGHLHQHLLENPQRRFCATRRPAASGSSPGAAGVPSPRP